MKFIAATPLHRHRCSRRTAKMSAIVCEGGRGAVCGRVRTANPRQVFKLHYTRFRPSAPAKTPKNLTKNPAPRAALHIIGRAPRAHAVHRPALHTHTIHTYTHYFSLLCITLFSYILLYPLPNPQFYFQRIRGIAHLFCRIHPERNIAIPGLSVSDLIFGEHRINRNRLCTSRFQEF